MALPWKTDRKQYRTQGSYRFSQEQRNSYFLYLDIKIISFVHQDYNNFKSNPPNGFWGYATTFCGSTPEKIQQVEFPNQRMVRLEGRNNLTTAVVAQAHKANIFSLESLAISLGGQVQFVDAQPPTVVGFPETIVKFKGLPLSQFQFSCYWLRYEPFVLDGVLFESDDPTDGESEYYEPTRNPRDNPYQGNEQPSEPDENNDERDYGEEPDPTYPRAVYFGVKATLSTGRGAPDNCRGDAVGFYNEEWLDAGPPPYSIELGGGGPSPCAGRTEGYQFVASDGTKSEVFFPDATTFEVEINVFQFEPFEET